LRNETTSTTENIPEVSRRLWCMVHSVLADRGFKSYLKSAEIKPCGDSTTTIKLESAGDFRKVWAIE
jgi:hypothetical protein